MSNLKIGVFFALGAVLLFGYTNCEKPLSSSQSAAAASSSTPISSAAVSTPTPIPLASPSPLAATTNVSSVSASGSFTIAATGGVPPYSYSVIQGTATVEGSMVVGPFSSGTVAVNVTDTAGTVVTVSVSVTSSACTTAWGASVPNGGTVSAYQASAVNCGSVCLDEVQTCTNGVLSGTFTQQNCAVTPNTCVYVNEGSPDSNVRGAPNDCGSVPIATNTPTTCSTIGSSVCLVQQTARSGTSYTVYVCAAPPSSQ